LMLTFDEVEALKLESPLSTKYIKKYIGAQEFIQGIERWCLWISDDEKNQALSIPTIRKRVEQVAIFRIKSTKHQTIEMAKSPHRFGEIRHINADSLVIPIHFSEDREYFTIGLADGESTVLSNACYAIYGAEPWVMAVLSTKLHAAWVRTVCGQLETRIRYSNTMGYHTFPLPELSAVQKEELEAHTWAIIAARESHPGKSIAWLYNPETMPSNLLVAHQNLDQTIERVCIGRTFKSDTERLEYLFKQYVLLKQKGDGQTSPELNFKGKKK
jgi:hypothetical protein